MSPELPVEMWPWLAELGEARTAFETHRDGSAIALDPDRVTLLIRGELAEWREGRMLGIVEGPRALGLHRSLARRRSAVSYRALGEVTTTSVALVALEGSPAAVRMLVEQIDRLDEERFERRVADDDFFDPEASLVVGPYRFGPFEAAMLVVQGDDGRLRRLLPNGLAPLPGLSGRYLLSFTDIVEARVAHRDGPGHRYREVTPFLPCLGRGGPGLFVPELYPDSYMAILLGREIYGFPKRLGRIARRSDGFDLVVDDERLVRARWSSPRPLDAATFGHRLGEALWPRIGSLPLTESLSRAAVDALDRFGAPSLVRRARIYVRKRILDAEAERHPRYAIDELVEVPFELDHASDFGQLGELDLRFASHPVLHGRATAGFAMRMGFSFGRGQRRRRYPTLRTGAA